MEHSLNIINQYLQFQKVLLVEPSKSHYLHMAAEIDHSLLPFFVTTSAKKKALISHAKNWCGQLEKEDGIISAVVFKASVIPPGKGKYLQERQSSVQIAKYDFVILIETNSADKIESIRHSSAYIEMELAIKKIATFTHVVTATNVKQINPVNHNKRGVFLFNYFFADSLQQNLRIWEYTAGWFQQETGLSNSTVLLPTNQLQSKYTIINHCRWNNMQDVLPSLPFKKSFHSYVLRNFYANKIAAMPVLYKMA